MVHLPQFLASAKTLTQDPAQLVWPALHTVAQLPAAQTCPVAQAVPHLPQFLGSLRSLAHALVQSVLPGEHLHEPP